MNQEITKTGDGLAILINCKYIPIHNWMVFASWYSIRTNLPDAQIAILCQRNLSSQHIFLWPYRLPINFFQYSDEKNVVELAYNNQLISLNKKLLVFQEPTIMAISTYESEEIVPACSTSLNHTFVSFEEKCGKFEMNQWKDRIDNPFNISLKLITPTATINEMKILKLWNRMKPLFDITNL